eukprot:SAG11_NODE_5620_length_1506_cov_0.844350_1_plen_42_part_00
MAHEIRTQLDKLQKDYETLRQQKQERKKHLAAEVSAQQSCE